MQTYSADEFHALKNMPSSRNSNDSQISKDESSQANINDLHEFDEELPPTRPPPDLPESFATSSQAGPYVSSQPLDSVTDEEWQRSFDLPPSAVAVSTTSDQR